MRVFFYLFLVLLGLGSARNAIACSYAPIVFSGIDDYSVYDSYTLKRLINPETRVALIRTIKVKKVTPEKNKMMFATDDSKVSVYEMRLEVVEVLKGEFSKEENITVPEMSKTDQKRLKSRLDRQTDFNYWDWFSVSFQVSSWYGDITSCGPSYDKVLDKNQHYVIAQSGTYTFIAEPVTGPEDTFVQDIKNLVLENEDSPIKISVEYFFKNMDGYKVFDVTACLPPEEGFEDVPLLYQYEHLRPEEFEKFDYIQGVVEETTNETKLKPQNFMFRHHCNVGDRFLVLEKLFSDDFESQPDWPLMPDPIHRYAKISNGMINLDDIPTNYEFTGEKIIPVEQVKTWIREGHEAAEAE